MASLEMILIIVLVAGVLAYLLGKLNKVLSGSVTILASGFAFVSIAYYGFNNGLDTTSDLLPFVTYGVENLSLYFGIIVTFVFFMVSFFNPYFIDKYKYPSLYSMLYLFSLAGVIGVFFTNNFIVLFFFFELVVWSSLFLIPLGKSKKAASWYYGFSAFGSFALLFAILIMSASNGGSFEIASSLSAISGSNRVLVFILLMIAGFAKLGAFPLHIWLPKVLTHAPDPVTSVFSGGLEKLGAFIAVIGLLKVMPVTYNIEVLDMQVTHYLITVLGALTIVFGTLMAIRQDDAKKLLAYSSMSNAGYILVGLAIMSNTSVSGALYHVLAHALASTAAFLAIGAVKRQTGTAKMSQLGGIIHKMPVTYLVYLIAIISMAGIPPMGGFVSKWLIFQSVIDEGLIFIAIATFFGSIGSFLYVFRPLAALFLGQELPQYKKTIKEVPLLMMLPLLILSALNIFTGVYPKDILVFINKILVELNIEQLVITTWTITGKNGDLNPGLIGAIFGIGVAVSFLIFIVLKKSKKVGLMDTYTAGNFVYTEELLHYSVDFYAPLERLYEKYIHIMKNFYNSLANKVKEFGRVVKYFFFTNKPEVTVLFIVLTIIFLLWGEIV
ncbi:NADH-quinone oxidoreductase subunit L [Candidatus Izimaplasma bacterium HR1]|jgi:NADH-quinone oxidoreductase subunit M|uniref:proton-conducting transporter transmembrane domain-containing protein n=1 Tax=Candidatus Izimoplasma sp. HR1 TaxID=1541959 RepID=UPI0004F723C6|nr:NADH-quinone oxidoreductase subunit L [Candidatus Izimaplasma bacterium HR1]